jgi:hypothetical protein
VPVTLRSNAPLTHDLARLVTALVASCPSPLAPCVQTNRRRTHGLWSWQSGVLIADLMWQHPIMHDSSYRWLRKTSEWTALKASKRH